MASQSSVLAWRIPWREEPGGLQSMRVAKSWTRRKRLGMARHDTTGEKTWALILRPRTGGTCLDEKERCTTERPAGGAWCVPEAVAEQEM